MMTRLTAYECSLPTLIFNRTGLNWNAVPTIIKVPNPPPKVTPKRLAPSPRAPLPPPKRRRTEPTVESLYKVYLSFLTVKIVQYFRMEVKAFLTRPFLFSVLINSTLY